MNIQEEVLKPLLFPREPLFTNMGAELGATTSLFPSDTVTRKFLKLQKREDSWTELKADPDSKYDRIIEINLSEIEPMIAPASYAGQSCKGK